MIPPAMSERDDKLAGWIRDDLRKHVSVSGQLIDVSVRHGVVTLRGAVPSHRRKLIAQEIASCYDGCREVINEIHVQPARAVSDTEVAGHVRAMLDAHADITKGTVAVTVKDGEVTLAGNLGSHAERTLAIDLAMSVRGVRSVQDVLIVDLHQQIDDEALSRQIEAELERARGLRGAHIKVAVNVEVAVLSGRVNELWQKQTAEAVALRFPLRAVRNDIVVGGALSE